MNVVLDATDDDRGAFQFFRDAAKVCMDLTTEVGITQP
jgi:hypothetical protein